MVIKWKGKVRRIRANRKCSSKELSNIRRLKKPRGN